MQFIIRNVFVVVCIAIIFVGNSLLPVSMVEKEIVVMIASYNNKDWYKKNIKSVLNQKYTNYKAIYIDDCSPDGTGNRVEKYLKKHDINNKVMLIKNTKRYGAMANHYRAIHSCADDAIIVNLDGDDWFAHLNVLAKINEVYQTKDVWLTYGQFKSWPADIVGFCREFPHEVIENNSFRSYDWISSHPRTFYAWLFKKIDLNDFMFEGKFFEVDCDQAEMLPMLEMAGFHIACISEVLYRYNNVNPLNDDKQRGGLMAYINNFIRNKARYAPFAL